MDIFVADSMHGKLAKKLRFFGFDTLYDAQVSDDELVRIATDENRILLTSDHDLHRICTSKNIKAVYITKESDLERIIEIGKLLNWKSLDDSQFSTRCTLCNSRLMEVNKNELQNALPKNTFQRFNDYCRCSNCLQIYWKGSHWSNMMQINENVNKKL